MIALENPFSLTTTEISFNQKDIPFLLISLQTQIYNLYLGQEDRFILKMNCL